MAGQQLVLFYWFWAVTLHYSATSLFHSSEGHKIIMVLHRRYSLFRGMHTPRHFLSIGKCTGIIHFWFCPHLKRLEICQFSKLIVLFIAKTPVYFKFNIVLPPSLKIRIVRHKKLSCCQLVIVFALRRSSSWPKFMQPRRHPLYQILKLCTSQQLRGDMLVPQYSRLHCMWLCSR